DANALRSLAPADMREFVNDWDWPHASNVQLSIRGPSAAAATWKGDGILQLQRGRFRTIGFNSASANVHFGDGAVTYETFRVARDEGVATGTFVYDFAHHETRLSNVVSGLRPTEAIYWIDPQLLKVVTPYKFQRPPTITTSGVYQFSGGNNTRLEINVDSPGGMYYVYLGNILPLDHVNAMLLPSRSLARSRIFSTRSCRAWVIASREKRTCRSPSKMALSAPRIFTWTAAPLAWWDRATRIFSMTKSISTSALTPVEPGPS